ncbi:Gfo/Idh/MocA family oxidoreductase [Acidisoma cellulosilytica]|uniref:Gfo/Idh/MocA family oxidoreductase n=2 Tax=Acidisoma cellulosilyticum TaxID=2802395 RepID=A0A963YY62_9PROT|nr:Gfo/Idh/MocA family oxidoreductase [Acidisoma cellulosilyticum]
MALIGCGFFAQNHLHSWASIPEVEIVAVCDRDAAKAEAAQKNFGAARAYTDAAEMFAAEKLDFVDIATTMQTHLALVEMAAAQGVHVIVQKPLAPSFEDCQKIVDTCAQAGVRLMVHENFRFQSPILAARRALADGRIGKPHYCQASFRSGYDVFSGQPYLATEKRFILIDLGIHILDVCRAIMGEAETLYCLTQHINPKIAGEDVATTMIRHRDGGVSVVDCSYASRRLPEPFPQTVLRIEGEHGTIELLEGYRLRVTSHGQVTEEGVEPETLSWTQKPWHVLQESVLNLQRHWVDTWRKEEMPETSGTDNLQTYALVMAAYRSAESGSVVTLAA